MRELVVVVRGEARRRYPAERATVGITADLDGTDRDTVYRRAVALQEPLTAELSGLHDSAAVSRWSSDQVRVYSYRPYTESGPRPLMYRVAMKVEAEFTDFEQLAVFLDRWAIADGVEIGGIRWDVTEDNRRAYEAELRAEAVGEATAKAQAYATAAGRGDVMAVQLADPGMLGDEPVHPRAARMMVGGAPPGAAPALELRPDDIRLAIAVDARFIAE